MQRIFRISLILFIAGILICQCASLQPREEAAPSFDIVKRLFEQGNYAGVIHRADSLAGADQESPLLYYYKGLAYLRKGSIEKALDAYHTAADSQQNAYMDSAYAAELAQRAMRVYEQNKFEAVLSLAQQAISIQETNTTAHYAKFMVEGRQLLEHGSKWELWDAIIAFGNAAELKPENPIPHYYLARTYRKKDDQDFTNIIAEYEKSLDRNPPASIRKEIEERLEEARRRKKLYEDFWGQ